MSSATLRSIIPTGAVPQQVRSAVSPVLEGWGYQWADVALAGTVALSSGGGWHADDLEAWVIAVRADPIGVDEEFEPGEGRTAGVQASGGIAGVMRRFHIRSRSSSRCAGAVAAAATAIPPPGQTGQGPVPVGDEAKLHS